MKVRVLSRCTFQNILCAGSLALVLRFIYSPYSLTSLFSRAAPASTLTKGSGTYNLVNAEGTRKIGEEPDWSQSGQTEVIDGLLSKKRGGFFVELGGLDGEEFSNSLFFEINREWDGLLVEANPYAFKQMLRTDRACWMKHACISKNVPEMKFKVAGSITSSLHTMSKSHESRIARDIPTYRDSKTWEGSGSLVTTACTTLNALLDSIGHTHVDFFSLDVEGAELHVLQSIDFGRLSFDLVMIETQENREQIVTFMRSNGFELVKALPNDSVFKFISRSELNQTNLERKARSGVLQ